MAFLFLWGGVFFLKNTPPKQNFGIESSDMEYENNFLEHNSWLHFVFGARIWISCARFGGRKQSHKYQKFRKFTNNGDFSIIPYIEPRIYVPSGRRPIPYFFVSGSGMMPRTKPEKEKIYMIFSAIFLLSTFSKIIGNLALKST